MDGGDIPQDDFKWFGEGFEGFPKRLPDSTVEYTVFVVDQTLQNDSAVRTALNEITKEVNKLSKDLLKDYIWQREPFKLELARLEGMFLIPRLKLCLTSSTGRWVLQGQANYGDSVADEWLIVYLLRELSRKFSETWIRVFDTDGEFLLIEAANALPRWLNPEVAEKRVWIHDGQLRIIPLAEKQSSSTNKSEMVKKPLTISEALSFIASTPDKLIHSPLIEEEAFYRLRIYPSEISSSLHNSVVTIPRKLAYLLHRNPSYISPAVEAFYVRDPISLKPLQQPDSSDIYFPAEDLVTVSVRFTKVGFAQLKSQEFDPPPAWMSIFTSPTRSDDSQEKNRLEMGMKVTSAFEMVLHDPQTQKQRAVQEMKILLEDIDAGEEPLPTDAEISTWSKSDNDEGWLDIDMNDFDRELSGKKVNEGQPKGQGFGDKSAEEMLKKMVQRFEDFLKDDDAGAEGAEYLDDMDYDDDEDSEETSDEEEDREVSFDEAQFEQMMREMMGLPPEVPLPKTQDQGQQSRIEEIDSDSDSDTAQEIEQLSKQMEAELRTAGALKLDPPKETPDRPSIKGKEKAMDPAKDEDQEESDEEIDVDFNLVKNMLESLKSEQGMSGPAGNLLASMGIRMPRDDGEKAEK
jgi:hypothetical protein